MDFKLNNTLFILDTETGGVDPNVASLMEIAGVVLKDNKVVYEYSALVKSPTGKYVCNEFARSLHKIEDDQINKDGKLPTEIMQDLKNIKDKYFGGQPMTIVAHNAAFDIGFVKKMFADNGEKLTSEKSSSQLAYDNIFSRNAIDTATMALVLRLQGKLNFDRCSLDNILKFYNIPIIPTDRHSALYDARQTAKAFKVMMAHLANEKLRIEHINIKKYDKGFDDFNK